MEDGDLSFANLATLTEREILILNVHETHELKCRVKKVEEGIDQLKGSPMCDDHEIRLTRIETTYRITLGVIATVLAVFTPVIMWVVDKVI